MAQLIADVSYVNTHTQQSSKQQVSSRLNRDCRTCTACMNGRYAVRKQVSLITTNFVHQANSSLVHHIVKIQTSHHLQRLIGRLESDNDAVSRLTIDGSWLDKHRPFALYTLNDQLMELYRTKKLKQIHFIGDGIGKKNDHPMFQSRRSRIISQT